jgi:hypothetical protein
MNKIFLAVFLCLTPLLALAAAGDTRIAELYVCELKEGKEMDAVKANNIKWLAYTRKAAGSDDVRSYALTPLVGDLSTFMFVDSFPDMATWSKVKSALKSPEGEAIEAGFEDLMDCAKNRLYESEQH